MTSGKAFLSVVIRGQCLILAPDLEQLQIGYRRSFLWNRAWKHESKRIHNDVHWFFTCHEVQWHPATDNIWWIHEVSFSFISFFPTQDNMLTCICVHILDLFSEKRKHILLQVRALPKECLQKICNGTEADIYHRGWSQQRHQRCIL